MKYIYDSGDFRLEVTSDTQEFWVRNPDTTLLYLIEEAADIRIGDEFYNMKAEDCYIINRSYDYMLLPQKDILMCYITISSDILNRYLQIEHIMFGNNSIEGNNKEYSILRNKIKEILDIAITLPEGKLDVRMGSLFYQILECLIENFLISQKDMVVLNKGNLRKNQIAQYVEKNFHQPITLNKLAEELFLTYYYLSRNFKNIVGMSFHEYVNKVRLKHVVNDLLYTQKNMIEIAMDNGFTSSSILNRAFKEVYHMTPTEFKKSMKNSRSIGKLEEKKKNIKSQIYEVIEKDNLEDKISDYIEKCVVSADVTKFTPYKKVFNNLINIGFAADLLSAGLQEHILLLNKELGFTYIRLWNVFHDKMELRNGHDTTNLNFEKIDHIFDFLIEHRLKPFIEFGSKPKIIVNEVKGEGLYENEKINSQKFKGKDEFRQLLEAFIEHIIERYGIEEVTTWQYEFWNEFVIPGRKWSDENVDFFEIFDIAYEVIKSHIPDTKVGGGGTPINLLCEDFYQEWTKRATPDFVSIMVFPYRVYNKTITYETDVDTFVKAAEKLRACLQALNMDCKIYVTEWNSTISSRNYQNDSCYQAAYCIKNAVDILEKVDLVGFWVGSDRFTTAYDSVNPIYGGSGLISKDGICKPAFFSFQFLNSLGCNLIKSEEKAIITSDKRGNYAIVCHNYRFMDYKYYMITKVQQAAENYLADSEKGGNMVMEFKLEGVTPGTYRISMSEMGPSKGGILEEWKKLNFEPKLRKEEIEYLKSTCNPRLSIDKVNVKEDGIFTFALELEPQEIALLKIDKI